MTSSVEKSGYAQCDGHCQEECIRPDDFCESAIPIKPGTYVNAWNNAMVCAAKSNDFVISRDRWFNGGSEPGPEAHQFIQQLAHTMASTDDHVLLEAEPVFPAYDETLEQATVRTDLLNTARRDAVVTRLEDNGVTDADTRVHLGPLEPVGIYGIEAPQVYTRIFQGNGVGGGQNGGGAGGGFGGGQGFGGGGFGGGGGVF